MSRGCWSAAPSATPVRQREMLSGETADSLADEYYPYDLVRDSPLASPAPASPVEILAGLGHKLRGHVDEIRPRVATTEERRLLSLPQVSVVLELARTAHDSRRHARGRSCTRSAAATAPPSSTRSATRASNPGLATRIHQNSSGVASERRAMCRLLGYRPDQAGERVVPVRRGECSLPVQCIDNA